MSTTLLYGGRVRSPGDPFATAMLVVDGTVAWVGADAAAGSLSAERFVDLAGALVTPAFVDAHVHTTSTGLALEGLDLTGVPSLAVALDRVERAARALRGGILLGTGWDETRWPERRPPTAAELDRASYGGVVYLARTDVHSAVVSSALVAAVPAARGLPGFLADGLVRVDAHHAFRSAAFASISPSQRMSAQRATLARAAAVGIGCYHELSGPEIASEADLVSVLQLARTEPGPKVLGYWGSLRDVETPRRLGLTGAGGDLFCDGALGSHTAALSHPYCDDPTSGSLRYNADEVADHVVAVVRAGMQAGFHVIGDLAVDTVLDGIEIAVERLGDGGLERLIGGRHRLEHAEMLSASGIERMARLGLVASVQPAFDATWGGPDGMYVDRLGAERAGGMNPFAALAEAGVPIALGSDSPVTPLDPWAGVRAAVHHRTSGSGLSARAAFSAATRGGWRAAWVDDAGDLAPGAPATYAVWDAGELVVEVPDDRVAGWSTDPRAAVAGLPDLSDPAALPRCLRTVVRGRTVHDDESLEEKVSR